MRIMILAQFYPPFLGGEEQAAHNLASHLAARGHQITVVTSWSPGFPECQELDGVRVYRIQALTQRLPFLYSDSSRRHVPAFPDPESTLALRRIIAQERPEIVHGLNWMIHAFLPLKSWSGAKLVLSIQDHGFNCPKKKLIHQNRPCDGPAIGKCLGCAVDHYGPIKGAVTMLTHRLCQAAEYRLVDLFLPVSEATARDSGIASSGAQYQVVHNFIPEVTTSVDDLDSSAKDKYLAQLPAPGYLLFVGAFGWYKGVDVLFEAYRGLNGPPLVVIGYDTAEYRVRTPELPAGVVVLKNWPHGAIREAWQRCSIGIVPSVWSEPFGIVAIEAMEAAKPVVASDIGGLAEIVIHEETGLLVAPGDASQLRLALARLIADPALAARLGQAGQRRLARFSANSILARYEAAYAMVLGRTAEPANR